MDLNLNCQRFLTHFGVASQTSLEKGLEWMNEYIHLYRSLAPIRWSPQRRYQPKRWLLNFFTNVSMDRVEVFSSTGRLLTWLHNTGYGITPHASVCSHPKLHCQHYWPLHNSHTWAVTSCSTWFMLRLDLPAGGLRHGSSVPSSERLMQSLHTKDVQIYWSCLKCHGSAVSMAAVKTRSVH